MTWLIELVKEDGIHCPKTLIFCNGTLTDISVVTNFLLQKLGKYAYDPQDCQVPENCLNGIIDSGIRRIGDWGLGREYVEIKKKLVTWF